MAKKKTTVESRFWQKVNKTDTCWLWTSAVNEKGYGMIHSGSGRAIRAHRVSWVMQNGPIPNDLCVLHKCDVTACVRPDHLFLGTRADNMNDCRDKGRCPVGAGRWNAKLTDELVQSIRSATGTCVEIGRQFGVSPASVSKARRGLTWGHASSPVHAKQRNGKLTDDNVRAIRAAAGTHRSIAHQFGVSKSAIDRLRQGLTWKHVDNP